MVEKPEHYQFSSYSAFLGLKPPTDFLKMDIMMEFYENKKTKLRKRISFQEMMDNWIDDSDIKIPNEDMDENEDADVILDVNS